MPHPRARKHRAAAIMAVAHKLARACYPMLHEDTTFDLSRAFALITLMVAGRSTRSPAFKATEPDRV